MLSSLATYLFGQGQNADQAQQQAEDLQETPLPSQDGDDWILIDAQRKQQAAASGGSRSRSVSDSGSDMSVSEEESDHGGATTDEMPSEIEQDQPAVLAVTKSITKAECQPSVPELPSAPLSTVPQAAPRKRGGPRKLAQGQQRQVMARYATPGSKPLSDDQELPVVDVPSPTLPGPRSYAQMAASKTQPPQQQPMVEGPSKASVLTAPKQLPTIVAKPPPPPPTSTKPASNGAHKTHKKSNKRGATVSSLAEATDMEGSWFVTPPPCFTRPNTFMMQSSPLEDILIENPMSASSSFNAKNSAPAPQPPPRSVEFTTDSPMTASVSSSGSSTRSPTPPPPAISNNHQASPYPAPTLSSPVHKSPPPPPPAPLAMVRASLPTGPRPTAPSTATVMPESLLSIQPAMVVARVRKLRRPQLQREPLAELATSTFGGNVSVRPVRTERKSRKQTRKEAREAKAAAELRKPQTPEAAIHAALLAEVRARAFEPIKQERQRQLRSQLYSKANMARANYLSASKPHGRQAKMAAMPGGHSVNRKVNRNC